MLQPSVNSVQLEQLIKDHEIVFVDFWANWCAPCKVFALVYEKVADKNPLICFAKVDVEHETDLAETFQIRSIPHLLVFKQGIVIYSESGSIPETALDELVTQALAVDMSKVISEIDKTDE